jgi:putative membrane protein
VLDGDAMQASHPSTPVLVSAAAVLAAGLVVLAFHDPGPQARHMALHIFAMNVLAPVLAALAAARRGRHDMRARWLWIAALGQIAALFAAHAPAVQSAAMARPLFQAAMHLLLAAVAVAFWLAVLAASAARPWHAVAALALSAKLFCLLAVLLVFAPRSLHVAQHHATALDDQQLAGLLMIAACPLSYLVAALLFTVRLIGSASRLRPVRSAG